MGDSPRPSMPSDSDPELAALLASAPGCLSGMTSLDEVFQFVTASVPTLFPGCMVLVFRSTFDGNELELIDIQGLESSLFSRAAQVLGYEPRGRRFRVEDWFRQVYSRTELFEHPGGLEDFAADVLPPAVSHAIEKLLSIQGIFSIGLARGDLWFGNLNVFVREPGVVLPKAHIESFVHQCFLALSRIQTMNGLRESEARNRTLLEALPVAVLVAQGDRYAYANPASLSLLGYETLEQFVGTPLTDVIHPESAPLLPERRARAAHGDANPAVEMRALRKDGSTLTVESASVPIVYGGRPAALIISRDLTEQKRAEEARLDLERNLHHAQKLEGLGVLAGGIAHDFNNLLAAVIANLDLALQDLPPASSSRECIDEAVLAARRAVDLTQQMLAYAGKATPAVRPMDLNQVLDDNARLFRTSVSRTLTMELRLSRSLRAIQADPGQIQQLVMNLITNAAEAVGDAPGRVTIETGLAECDESSFRDSRVIPPPEPGTFVFLEVSDTGQGMDAATQRRMFDPFFSTRFLGRGLGLAAALGIVRAHRGAVIVRSAPSRGTSVRVLFPALTSSAAAVHPRKPMPNLARFSGLALVVDDDPMVCKVCARMMGRLGFTVETAEDGLAAVERFRTRVDEWACVILDLTMPRMDGANALRAMKQLRRDVPVFLSSGLGESHAQERTSGLGMDGFVQKPYEMARLSDALAAVLPSDRVSSL